MTNQSGNRANTYEEAILRLKSEIQKSVESFKTDPAWAAIERDYQALIAIEAVAGARKTKLEELLLPGLRPTGQTAGPTSQTPPGSDNKSKLALGDQQETEMAAEIEKGS